MPNPMWPECEYCHHQTDRNSPECSTCGAPVSATEVARLTVQTLQEEVAALIGSMTNRGLMA
jgi:hypothetical protein